MKIENDKRTAGIKVCMFTVVSLSDCSPPTRPCRRSHQIRVIKAWVNSCSLGRLQKGINEIVLKVKKTVVTGTENHKIVKSHKKASDGKRVKQISMNRLQLRWMQSKLKMNQKI